MHPTTHAPRVAFLCASLWLPLALAGCVTAATGCSFVDAAKFRAVKTVTAPCAAPAPLDVATGNGDITVTRADVSEVQISATIKATTQERLDAARVTAEHGPDGTLLVRVEWPEGKRLPNEGCAFDIRVPDVTSLTLKSTNGTLRTAGLSGPATLTTSNGEVVVSGHRGPVKAASSNGQISLLDVESAAADTSNGDVVVRLLPDSPGPVNAQTSNGEIVLTVGPEFQGAVKASTSNGQVLNASGMGVTVGAARRNQAVFSFGKGKQPCSLQSSNGSITIRAVP
jgi:DUF4097 and DUF4098 domain-containing protein YvlB